MKKLLLTALLIIFFSSCVTSNDTKPETVLVKYDTGGQKCDITYCGEDGSLQARYNVYSFREEFRIPVGKTACLSATKLSDRNNIVIRVEIYVNGRRVVNEVGANHASGSFEIESLNP